MTPLTSNEQAALDRLIAHAMRDSGQSRKVADFLLSWWNPDACGRFDMRIMWSCDDEIVADMVTIFALIGRSMHIRTHSDTRSNSKSSSMTGVPIFKNERKPSMSTIIDEWKTGMRTNESILPPMVRWFIVSRTPDG
jgi:hypothetical protein